MGKRISRLEASRLGFKTESLQANVLPLMGLKPQGLVSSESIWREYKVSVYSKQREK